MDPAVPLVVSQVNPDDLEWPRGHHRQPQLLDDAARAGPDGPARRRRPRAGRRRHLPGRQRHRRQGDQGAPGARSRRTSPASRSAGSGLPAPDRVQRPPAGRRLPRQRLHQGGVEGRRPRAARSSTCRTCASRARPSASRSSSPTPRPSTSRPAEPITPDRARTLFAAVPGRRRPGRPGDLDLSARDRRRRLATRSTSGGSARTRPSTTAAASPSGSSATTCARARRRTPSSSPRSWSSAGWVKAAAARDAAGTPA